ncbi:hypothetical protein ABPG75_002820 [Micractinium tetrahymenae]
MPLTATELAQCRKAFLVFDRNSDGVIDAAELRASLVTLGHPEPSAADVALLIAEIDADHSGGIEWDEFVKVIERQKAEQVGRGDDADTVEAFVALGGKPDGSGAVSVERLARTLAEFELRIDLPALLAEMDVDADGEVSYDEFRRLLSAA